MKKDEVREYFKIYLLLYVNNRKDTSIKIDASLFNWIGVSI